VARVQTLLFALLGFGRAGRILYLVLLVAAVPTLLAYFVWLPRMRFSAADEDLFRAARHGDRAGIEQALAAGARIGDASPVDGKTALFRAAVLGHADAVRLLLERGADRDARGNDGRTALEVVDVARADERDPRVAGALDRVAAALRVPEGRR